MTIQLDIFECHGAHLDDDFADYIARNPGVYRSFTNIAFRLIAAGRTHYSADAILHIIRYKQAVKKDVFQLFKINNNFSSRFARKFIADFPEHGAFFELRKLKSAS